MGIRARNTSVGRICSHCVLFYGGLIDKRFQSLFLLTQCNHFIVTTSTFNWWGAWLSERNDKIILRPSDKFFNDFYLNNQNFWPLDWTTINA